MPTETAAALTVRQLPPEEWSRLAPLPFAERGLPNPELTCILVAENQEGQIVGLWAAQTAVHLDGLWVHPDYRKHTRVAASLLRAMKHLLASLGIIESFTYTDSDYVLALALKAGFTRLPGSLLLLRVPPPAGDPACP